MKRIAYILAVALSAAACNRECFQDVVRTGESDFEFTADFADESKTSVQSDGAVWWSAGDTIMVYQGTTSSGKFASTNTSAAKTTSFTGTMTTFVGSIEEEPANAYYWAVYPYTAAKGCDGESVTLTVDNNQTAQEGTFASGLFPAIAKSGDVHLSFYNVCGGVKFTVFQSGITSVTFRGNNNESVAGTVKVSMVSGEPIVQAISDAYDVITVNAPSENGFVPGKSYFIVTLPTALDAGYTITYTTASDTGSYSSSTGVQIKRRTFGVLTEKDKNCILFKDSEAKAACIEKFDSNKDGNLSLAEVAAATSLDGLFANHTGVVTFPELKYFTGVSDLAGCFNGCASLTNVDIPENIKTIGQKALYGCSSLESVLIPSSVQSIGSEAFRDCTSLASVTISEGVSTISQRAFYNTALQKVILPSTIESIGSRAFGNETKEVVVLAMTPPVISEVSFGTDTIFYVPDEAYDDYLTADEWKEIIENIQKYGGIDLSANGTANTYIVSSHGKYKFNARVKGNSTESIGIPASYTGDGVKNLLLVGNYLVFETNETSSKGGFITISARDNSGSILWSWNIWLRIGFDPVATSQEYYNSGIVMMDRDLGAESSTSIGALFYWGDRCPTGKSTNNEVANHDSWRPSEDPKGINDPCPLGWRVPDYDVWSSAFGETSEFSVSSEKKYIDFGSKGGTGYSLGASESINYPYHIDAVDILKHRYRKAYWWSSVIYNDETVCLIISLDSIDGITTMNPRFIFKVNPCKLTTIDHSISGYVRCMQDK